MDALLKTMDYLNDRIRKKEGNGQSEAEEISLWLAGWSHLSRIMSVRMGNILLCKTGQNPRGFGLLCFYAILRSREENTLPSF